MMCPLDDMSIAPGVTCPSACSTYESQSNLVKIIQNELVYQLELVHFTKTSKKANKKIWIGKKNTLIKYAYCHLNEGLLFYGGTVPHYS